MKQGDIEPARSFAEVYVVFKSVRSFVTCTAFVGVKSRTF
jgi:hypothetical protein